MQLYGLWDEYIYTWAKVHTIVIQNLSNPMRLSRWFARLEYNIILSVVFLWGNILRHYILSKFELFFESIPFIVPINLWINIKCNIQIGFKCFNFGLFLEWILILSRMTGVSLWRRSLKYYNNETIDQQSQTTW